jgi:hypothetical protein
LILNRGKAFLYLHEFFLRPFVLIHAREKETKFDRTGSTIKDIQFEDEF